MITGRHDNRRDYHHRPGPRHPNSGYAPTTPVESAIIADLPPGNYTAIVRGVNKPPELHWSKCMIWISITFKANQWNLVAFVTRVRSEQ